jgi:ATP-dependent protease ClpP protease subunit
MPNRKYPEFNAKKLAKGIKSTFITAKGNDSEEDDQQGTPDKFLSYASTNHVCTRLNVYLDEGIQAAKYYRPLIEHMLNLSENDMVVFKVDNHGGLLEGAIALINAMHETEAQVEVVIAGACISAASLFALSAPVVSIAPHAYMMLHSGSFGTAGKQENVEAHVEFLSPKVKRLMQEVYQDFITDEEFSDISKGRELWLDTAEIHRRLLLRQEIRLKREKDAQLAATKVQSPKSKVKPK